MPASSANLGPGYDVLAAALDLPLELEVEETGTFSVSSNLPSIPIDRSNLCVRAFERLRPAAVRVRRGPTGGRGRVGHRADPELEHRGLVQPARAAG